MINAATGGNTDCLLHEPRIIAGYTDLKVVIVENSPLHSIPPTINACSFLFPDENCRRSERALGHIFFLKILNLTHFDFLHLGCSDLLWHSFPHQRLVARKDGHSSIQRVVAMPGNLFSRLFTYY